MYQFQVGQGKEELLLGHLSMLLDVLVVKNKDGDNFIITCDRDEKIRVSYYPNCYNIHNICLGHLDFVTRIQLIPEHDQYLLSASGDGTMKVWKYLDSLEVSSRLCYPDAGVQELAVEEDESGRDELKIKKRTTPAVKTFEMVKAEQDIIVTAIIET